MTRSRRDVLKIAAASTVSIALAGCTDETESSGGGGANGNNNNSGGGDNSAEGVVLTEHEWTVIDEYDTLDDTYGVAGRGENRTDETRTVFISVNFYDADDVQFSDTATSVSDVKPSGVFEFEARFLGDDPDRVDHYTYTVEAYAVD